MRGFISLHRRDFVESPQAAGWSEAEAVEEGGLGFVGFDRMAQMLEQESGLTPDRSVAADEAVAHGAALYAGLLLSNAAGIKPTMRVTNVNSHDLGVLAVEKSTGRPRNVVLIPRNTSLPASHSKTFRTQKDGQRSVMVKVIEGGDSSGNNSTLIGSCLIRDLPPDLPRGTPVDVAFMYQENGRLTVAARITTLEKAAILTLERAAGLSDESLAVWDKRLQADGGPLEFKVPARQ